MPLQYDSRLGALLPVLDEHAEWFGRVLRFVFYPELDIEPEFLRIPENFDMWVQALSEDGHVEKDRITQIEKLHGELKDSAVAMMDASRLHKGQKPDIVKFDALNTLYDEFIIHLRRLERDLAAADSGLDSLTGLRNARVMEKDIERELERRSRRGRPFCLALARVDNYADIKEHLSAQEHDSIIVAAGEIIKQCIRSFDDAYRLKDGEFLMSLKQTEIAGGSAGLNRLKKLLDEHAPYYNLHGKDIQLTMSSCVAEPQPGDVVTDLVSHMRKDLDRYGGDAETALEYLEVSPLQRFVSSSNAEQGDKPE